MRERNIVQQLEVNYIIEKGGKYRVTMYIEKSRFMESILGAPYLDLYVAKI